MPKAARLFRPIPPRPPRRRPAGAENAWNTRDPGRVALAYTPDSVWRNRSEFFRGREAIAAFLTRKWAKELDYRLIKEVWPSRTTASRCASPMSGMNAAGAWFRSHGNEQWAFNPQGLMERREASINDVPISESDRLFRWPLGPRPEDHPGLTELGL